MSKKIVEMFTKNFVEQLRKTDELLGRRTSLENNNYLPDAFSGKGITINSIYSTDKEHLMIIFSKSGNDKFNYYETNGSIFNVFDPLRVWGNGSAIMVENSRGIQLKSVGIKGMKPFELVGQVEMVAEDFTFFAPFPANKDLKIDYMMIFSKEIFFDILQKQEAFANRLVKSYSDFYEKTGEKFNTDISKTKEYILYLNELKENMKKYFFSGMYKETEIDDFIANHPEILQYGLELFDYKSQVVMEDIHGENKQDLKPDLIGYNTIKETWVIVEYKLPEKKIIRGSGKVRASVTADITVLKSQLKSYRDYFSDTLQKNHVNNLYKIDVKKHPPTIGIIGIVKPNERDEFNEERQEQPGWFELMSYDELYKRVSEYIRVVSMIQ